MIVTPPSVEVFFYSFLSQGNWLIFLLLAISNYMIVTPPSVEVFFYSFLSQGNT